MEATSDAVGAAVGQAEEAIRAKDIDRAVRHAVTALASGVEHPLLLNLRAHWHEQAGRVPEALADLERAQALAPTDASVANARGLCLARLGRMDKAFSAFAQAAEWAPELAPAHFNKGWSSEVLGDLDVARRSYDKALELAPGHAEAAAAASLLAARRGDAEACRKLADQALAVRPGSIKAILALASIEVGAGDFAAAEARLRSAIDRPDAETAPQHTAMALGLLADALDGMGRYAEAFAAYEAENALTRKIHAAEFAGPGVQTVPQFLAGVIDYFTHADPRAWRRRPAAAAANGRAAKHVFLMGFARSGTTLLQTALAGAPDVVTLEEREVLAEGVRRFMADHAALDRLAMADEAELEAFRTLYWRRVEEHGLDVAGRVFIDKNPFNTFKLPLIARLFPEARILFSVRDPRDVVLSCFRRHFAMNPALFEFLTLEGAARLYASTMQMFELCRSRLGLETHFVRYEQLADQFTQTTRAACDYIGVDWHPDIASFAERGRNSGIVTPSASQVARGLYSGEGQWRRYARQLEPVAPIIAPWVEHFGYR